MEIYIIVVLLVGYVFLLREYAHIVDKLEFYREKSVELNGILRMSGYFNAPPTDSTDEVEFDAVR